MTRTRRIAAAAARRATLALLVRLLGPSLALAALAGALLVVIDRTIALGLPAWLLISAPLAAGLLIAALLTLARRPSPQQAAIMLDDALGLRDRVSSALSLRAARNGSADNADDDTFLALAEAEGERVAATAKLSRAFPVRFDNWWAAWPVCVASLVAAALFVPQFDLLRREEGRVQEAAIREANDSAASALQEASRAARDALAEQAADAASPEDLAALDDIAEELRQGRLSPDEARSAAASRLDDLAQQFEQQAQRERRELDALTEQFAGLEPQSQQRRVRDLEESLRRGDFGAAAETLEQLRNELAQSDIPQEERDRAAEELRDLAQRLDDLARQRDLDDRAQQLAEAQEEPADAGASPSAEDALRDQGLSEDTAHELASETDAQSLRDRLQEEGLPPDRAQRLAERIAEENQQREAQERAEQRQREIADALRNAADEAREPPQPPADQPQGAQPDPSQQPQQPQQPQPGQQGAQGEQVEQGEQRPTPAQSPREGSAPDAQSDEQAPSDPERSPQQGPSQDVGSEQGDEQTAPQQGGEQRDAQEPQPQQDAQPQPGPADPSAPQGAQGDAQRQGGEGQQQTQQQAPEGAQGEQGAGEGESPQGGQFPAPGQQGQPSQSDNAQQQPGPTSEPGQGDGVGRSIEQLRRLAEQQRGSLRRQQAADELRDEARRLMDDMSPEERAEMRRLAEAFAREAGDDPGAERRDPLFDPIDTDSVDARRGETSDRTRTAAEWLTDARPGEGDGAGRIDPRSRVRDAADSAQRAIEEQAVPSRYADTIRRYFRRLPEAVDASPPAPAQDAPDADAGR